MQVKMDYPIYLQYFENTYTSLHHISNACFTFCLIIDTKSDLQIMQLLSIQQGNKFTIRTSICDSLLFPSLLGSTSKSLFYESLKFVSGENRTRKVIIYTR